MPVLTHLRGKNLQDRNVCVYKNIHWRTLEFQYSYSSAMIVSMHEGMLFATGQRADS